MTVSTTMALAASIFFSIAFSSVTWWAWLFPLVYVIHIAEEFRAGGGYSAHLARQKGVRLSNTRFLALTGLGLSLIVLGLFLAYHYKFPQTLLMILAALFLANGLSHTLTALTTSTYNPGLWSGVLLWIPLGLTTFWLLKDSMRWPRFVLAILIGFTIQATVSFLAARGGTFKTATITES